MANDLVLHRGAREVSIEELGDVPAPAPTATWFPISHAAVLHGVTETLDAAGFGVERQTLALSQDNAKFFGVLRLKAMVADGVFLAAGEWRISRAELERIRAEGLLKPRCEPLD